MSEAATGVGLDVTFFHRWMTELKSAVESGCDELTRLDAAIGDADHGINMLRGMQAVEAALQDAQPFTDPGAVLDLAGARLITVVGGAAGPLYGTAFREMGAALDPVPDVTNLAQAVMAGLDGIRRLGAAEPGDKTMVDAWMPAAIALGEAGDVDLGSAVELAEAAARAGMLATVPLRARKGRASYLGWRSEGHRDPGASSTYMIFTALSAAVRG